VKVARGPAADRTARPHAGELIILVAGGLTASGLDVHPPGRDGGSQMTISCHGPRCALSVTGWAGIEWERRPRANAEAAPQQVSDLTTSPLTGRPEPHPRRGSGYGRDSLTFKGIVGLELKAMGLDADLEVYEDKDYLDTQAETVMTSPPSRHDAAVHAADDCSLTWTRAHWPEAATTTGEPDFCGRIAGPAKVAAAVAETITRAMSQLAPAAR
jgi:hypothetical protein